MEPPVSLPSVPTAMLAATAAADPPLDPPGTLSGSHGIAHRSVSGVLIGRAHGELVAVELAEEDRPGGIEPRHYGRIIGRMIALQDFGTRRGRSTTHHQHVLDAHGDTGQRGKRVSFGRDGVDPRSLIESAVFGQRQVDVQLRVQGRDAVVIGGSKIDGLDRPEAMSARSLASVGGFATNVSTVFVSPAKETPQLLVISRTPGFPTR